MSKTALILIVAGWCLLQAILYFFGDFFTGIIAWLFLSAALLVVFTGQLIKFVRELKSPTALRTWKLITFGALFYFTFCSWIVHEVMEKLDWAIFYNKRSEVVQQVKTGQLKPNREWSTHICKLPFGVPVISDGGNEISISRNKTTQALTVEFWTMRGMPDGGSTSFVYSDDEEEIRRMEQRVYEKPADNFKMKEGWYRLKDE